MNAPLGPIGSVVIDFDGTICPHDVSEELLEAYAPAAWWEVDLEFRRGEIGSRECLVRQATLLRATREEMVETAVARFSVQPSFPPFTAWARSAGLEVIVASDGLGFYIQPMLAAAGLPDLAVLTNDVAFDGNRVSALTFPSGHPECAGCGTCKMLTVQDARRRGGGVAFVGEGHTDRYGALYADVVFAKRHLVDICRSDGVPFLPWETFDDVRAGLEALAAAPRADGRVGPDRCPGWSPLP